MSSIDHLLEQLDLFRCEKISLPNLFIKNPIAYKWKATYRSLVLRESVLWRTHDLLAQSQNLFKTHHILGSRILIRSALESISILIYLNQQIDLVLDGTLYFHDFSEKTSKLLLGSRDKSTKHEALSIVTILEKCERKYSGIVDVYATLSESAHPNYEGICFGYSRVNFEKHETNFSNSWGAMWADRHEALFNFIYVIIETEYNEVWNLKFTELERWLVENDSKLEATKPKSA